MFCARWKSLRTSAKSKGLHPFDRKFVSDSRKLAGRARGRNIILIGMPGAGKSTVGVVLAKRLGRVFGLGPCHSGKRGKLLHEIIEKEGLDGFLRIEEEVNASLEAEGAVIATGGSVVYGQKAMEHLKQIGTVIYLRTAASNNCRKARRFE